MEKQITVKSEYNSFATILTFLKNKSAFECTEDYDIWDVRTDPKGQMEKCVLIKKSAMHGMKLYFVQENVLNLTYIIPNKLMNAYFGKSQKHRRNILEIITGTVKNLILSSSQKKAFLEMQLELDEIST